MDLAKTEHSNDDGFFTSAAPFRIWGRTDGLIFDTTLVVATANAEVAFLSPIWIPGIGNLPILLTIFNAPSDNLDCMPTSHASGDVMVNSAGIVFKVAVNSESNF